ncbi:hypothetical protein ACN28S_58520 [Cystobacter fuscus]
MLEVAENNESALTWYRTRNFTKLDAAIFLAQKVPGEPDLLPPRRIKPRPTKPVEGTPNAGPIPQEGGAPTLTSGRKARTVRAVSGEAGRRRPPREHPSRRTTSGPSGAPPGVIRVTWGHRDHGPGPLPGWGIIG